VDNNGLLVVIAVFAFLWIRVLVGMDSARERRKAKMV